MVIGFLHYDVDFCLIPSIVLLLSFIYVIFIVMTIKEFNASDGLKLANAISQYRSGSTDYEVLDTLMWVFWSYIEEKFYEDYQDKGYSWDDIWAMWDGERWIQYCYEYLDWLLGIYD